MPSYSYVLPRHSWGGGGVTPGAEILGDTLEFCLPQQDKT